MFFVYRPYFIKTDDCDKSFFSEIFSYVCTASGFCNRDVTGSIEIQDFYKRQVLWNFPPFLDVFGIAWFKRQKWKDKPKFS